MNRDPRAAVRQYMQRARAQRKPVKGKTHDTVTMDEAADYARVPIVDLPTAEQVYGVGGSLTQAGPTERAPNHYFMPRSDQETPGPFNVSTPLDRIIAALPPDSGERHAWEELRRFRQHVILYLERIATAPTMKATADAANHGGEELAHWMRHAEREWPEAPDGS